jgi:hypothetical protein
MNKLFTLKHIQPVQLADKQPKMSEVRFKNEQWIV